MITARGNKDRYGSTQNMAVRSSCHLKVIVLDPVELYRGCLGSVLKTHFGRSVQILGVVPSLSRARQMLLQFECVDALIGAPYGVSESLLDWEFFCRLLGGYYPGLTYLVWTHLPMRFVRLLTPQKCWKKVLYLNKRISVDAFCLAVSQVITGCSGTNDRTLSLNDDVSVFPALTLRETLVLTELMEGKSMMQIAQFYHNSLKTISSHKCRAMKKLGVSSNAKLMSALHTLPHSGMVVEKKT